MKFKLQYPNLDAEFMQFSHSSILSYITLFLVVYYLIIPTLFFVDAIFEINLSAF
jgi:hypothetical protein